MKKQLFLQGSFKNTDDLSVYLKGAELVSFKEKEYTNESYFNTDNGEVFIISEKDLSMHHVYL